MTNKFDDITFIQEQDSVFILVACHASSTEYDEKSIRDAFEISAFSHTYFLSEKLIELIEELNGFIEQVTSELATPGEFKFNIAEQRDAKISIKVSRDKMSAKAKIEMPWGGEAPTMEGIKSQCKTEGVCFGVKRSWVENLLEKTFGADSGEVIEAEIAQGKDPKHGKNAYFKPLVELFADKVRSPTKMADGKVDLKDLGEIETVKPGEKIYQKIPFTAGLDGRNVLGETLPASPGKDAKLQTSSGTVISPDDNNVLLAKKEGLARLIDDRMEVDDVYTLVELTPKQGHVKFNGSVVILGDVLPDMKVIASGDVVIGGYVESASIRCRGELTVLSGASGKPLEEPSGTRHNNCLLESGNRINVSFANHVDIIAKRDVLIHKQISHCHLSAASLQVGQGNNPNGKVIGGRYFLSKFLVAGNLGAPSNVDTQVIMNRTYQVFKEKEQHFQKQVDELTAKVEKWQVKLSTLVREDQKNAVNFEIAQIENQISRNSQYRKTLIQRRREYMAHVETVANKSLFPGVQVQIGSKAKLISQQTGPSIARLVDYQLEVEPKTR